MEHLDLLFAAEPAEPSAPPAPPTAVAAWEAEVACFQQAPHLVAWEGELAEPGDFVTRDVGTTPLLLCRQEDGTLTARVNTCSHMAARLAVGCGSAERFVCHRHGWVYDRQGAVAYRPGPVNSPLKLSGRPLRTVPVAAIDGQVVVWPGGTGPGDLPELPVFPLQGHHLRPVAQKLCSVDAGWQSVREGVADRLAATYGASAVTVLLPGTVVVDAADHRLLISVGPGGQPGETRVHAALSVSRSASTAPGDGVEPQQPAWEAAWALLLEAFDDAVLHHETVSR